MSLNINHAVNKVNSVNIARSWALHVIEASGYEIPKGNVFPDLIPTRF